jgi:hypothetical protein
MSACGSCVETVRCGENVYLIQLRDEHTPEGECRAVAQGLLGRFTVAEYTKRHDKVLEAAGKGLPAGEAMFDDPEAWAGLTEGEQGAYNWYLHADRLGLAALGDVMERGPSVVAYEDEGKRGLSQLQPVAA